MKFQWFWLQFALNVCSIQSGSCVSDASPCRCPTHGLYSPSWITQYALRAAVCMGASGEHQRRQLARELPHEYPLFPKAYNINVHIQNHI
jgi:hypothetical protein